MIDAGRRRLLHRLAAAGAGALVVPSPARAQSKAPEPPVRRIDIHHHVLPPQYIEAAAGMRTGERAPPWTPRMSLEDMDRSGVSTAVMSLPQPGVWLGDVPQGRRLARLANEYTAGMQREHPGRFGSFAAIPLPDAEGSLGEIEYALDTLKADGIGLMTSYGDKWLGDRSFWPVYEELNRRKAVVYTHPLGAECCRALSYDVPASTIEYATDTTRTIASLLFSGTAARFPDIRWIFSHGGGTVPFLLSRFERAGQTMKQAGERLPKGVLYELRKFYYDTAQANHAGALAALGHLVPPAQMLFGSDFPFRPASEAVAGLAAYPYSAGDRRAIEHDNAARLLPRVTA